MKKLLLKPTSVDSSAAMVPSRKKLLIYQVISHHLFMCCFPDFNVLIHQFAGLRIDNF